MAATCVRQRFLRRTQEGQHWIANLFHHVHETHRTAITSQSTSGQRPETSAEPPRPHIAVNNQVS